jgi:hypothetical protein
LDNELDQFEKMAERLARALAALRFCRDVATEEWAHQGKNPGAECALRHIMNRAGRELDNS